MAGAVSEKAKRKAKLKKALWGSVASLILCMAMLAGTTFAWFTSTASAGVNNVQAGKMEVQLSYAHEKNLETLSGDEAWKTVDKKTILFKTIGDDSALNNWQPGTAKYVQLKVQNSGDLDLKYSLGISIPEEKESINTEGNVFKLSDYLKVAVLDGAQYFDTAADAIKAAEQKTEAEQADSSTSNIEVLQKPVTLSDGCVLKDELSSESDDDKAVQTAQEENTNEKIVTFIVYMPENNTSKEANYKAQADAPEIRLGVTLLAAQTASESDSERNDYDKDASFTADTQEQLQNALLNGGTIVLGRDMTIQNITISRDTVIDLAGHTLSLDPKNADSAENISAAVIIQKDALLKFTGEGKINIPEKSKDNTCLVRDENRDGSSDAGKEISSKEDWNKWLESAVGDGYKIEEESPNDDISPKLYIYSISKEEAN